jgi:hypothetical protein
MQIKLDGQANIKSSLRDGEKMARCLRLRSLALVEITVANANRVWIIPALFQGAKRMQIQRTAFFAFLDGPIPLLRQSSLKLNISL